VTTAAARAWKAACAHRSSSVISRATASSPLPSTPWREKITQVVPSSGVMPHSTLSRGVETTCSAYTLPL